MALTAQQQQRRRDWFRQHWETGVAFNRQAGISVQRWDPDGVELVLSYRDDLSAHDGVFHGGVIAALADTAGCAAVAAGHDFDNGSLITTTMLSLQFLAQVPGETLVAHASCTKRGRRTHFADVTVSSEGGVVVARALITVTTGGVRRGLEALDDEAPQDQPLAQSEPDAAEPARLPD